MLGTPEKVAELGLFVKVSVHIPSQASISHNVDVYVTVKKKLEIIRMGILAPLNVCKPRFQLGNLVVNHLTSKVVFKQGMSDKSIILCGPLHMLHPHPHQCPSKTSP